MKGYKFTARFYSPPVFFDPPILDALVHYAIEKELGRGSTRCVYLIPQKVRGPRPGVDGVREMYKLIRYWEGGIFLSTALQFDAHPEFLDSWKKRFDSKHSRLVDFGKARRRIDTASGQYRSYNMPLPAHAIREGWWYFIGDGPAVLDLLERNISAVGKKRSEGFGQVKEFSLEEMVRTPREIMALRPIPKEYADKMGIVGNERIMAWRPPYWSRANQALCVVPA